MPEPTTIDKNKKLPKAQDFVFLKKEGISYIEGLSGKVWTDYNTHDPGITLLEAMCYAFTDLGYRTSFEIEDIIAPASKSIGDKWKKIFYSAREALPCNPLTITDYRKLIIDTEGVKNAWIEISDDYEILVYLQKIQNDTPAQAAYNLTYDYKKGEDVLHLRGLYKVFVEFEDNILKDGKQDDVIKVIWEKLHFHRNLAEDFVSIDPVQYEYFPIQAVIQVSEGSDIETINAKIYKVINDLFSPSVTFYSLKEMLDKNISPEDFFNGPILNYGFIDTEELEKSERVKNIHISEIIKIISGIENVIAVKKISFSSDTDSPFSNFTEWVNDVKDKQKVPKLDDVNSNIIFERSGDRNRSGDMKQVNVQRVSAIFSFLKSDNFKNRLRGAGKDIPIPEGTCMDLADYYPFQKELPSIYGMEENFIDKTPIDKVVVAKSVRELLGENVGVNGAKIIDKLLNESRHSESVENKIDDIISGVKGDFSIIKTIIDMIWDHEMNDKGFKSIINELIGRKPNDEIEKHHLYHYIENFPEYITPSNKTKTLQKLAHEELKKSLSKIKSSGDIENLDSAYKKYQVILLENRKKLVLQLRGFLMVFEQILADYLSQLSHIKEIFSFDENVKQIFYPQLLDSINDIETLFTDFKHYKETGLSMIMTPEQFNDKRNNILDHLLSRYSESMNKYSFFMRQFAGKDAPKRLIEDKIGFLSDYVQISSYRGKGSNYADQNENWKSNNVEGLKKRICKLLGITNYERKRIAPAALFIEKIIIEHDIERYIVKLVDPQDKEHVLLKSIQYELESEAVIISSYILEHGYNRTLYKEEGHDNEWHFVLTRITPENVMETVAHGSHYKNSNERNNVLENVINILTGFSKDENFHIVEHILLRPKIGPRQGSTTSSNDEVTLLPAEYIPDAINFSDDKSIDTPYKFKIIQIKDQIKKGKSVWHLSLMKNEVEFLKVNEDFRFYKHLTKRLEHIREYGADSINYIKQPTIDGNFSFKIMANKTVLAESKKKFSNAADIDEEIRNLVNFLSYEFLLTGGTADENNPVLYADPYSFQLSIIFPSWQGRFRDTAFKHLLEKTIYLETPSHIYPHMYWANHSEMRQFDDAYELWIKEMAFNNEEPATDIFNNMIDALNKLKS
jgi:hypothetical protein